MVQSIPFPRRLTLPFGMPSWIVGVFVALLAGFIFMGGIRRIASVTEKLVPIMALLYIVGSLIVIGVNYQHIGQAFVSIFVGASGLKQYWAEQPVSRLKWQFVMVFHAACSPMKQGWALRRMRMHWPKSRSSMRSKRCCFDGCFLDTFVVLTLTALTFFNYRRAIVRRNRFKIGTGRPFSSVFGHFGDIFGRYACSSLHFPPLWAGTFR